MKLTDKGVSDQLVADMRTMLEGHLSEEPFNANAALKKQRVKGMQDKLENLRTQRKRADDSASQAREQGRDDAADGHEEKGDRINNNIRELKAKIRDEMNEDNTNDKSDDGEGLDKVKKDAVKKKFADRKDKDIDNDGDTDSSDEYLHKKRQAISKKVDESVAGKDAIKKQIDQINSKLKVIKDRLKKARAADDVKAGFTLSAQQVDLFRKRGDLEDKLHESTRQVKEGELPPALKKAIDKKKGKDTDDDEKEVEEGKLPPALQKAIDKKKGKDTDDDEKEVEEGKDKIKYRGNLKDLKAMHTMKEDFMTIIEKYGLDQVKTIINSIEK